MENKKNRVAPKATEKNADKITAVSSQKLLVAGAHFGHQTKRWNPKMKKFIYTSKKGVHVINLSKTIQRAQVAYNFLKTVSEKGGDIIFVGTKKQAKNAIKEQAQRCGAMYVSERWLGGTLTNFRTIKNNFRRMAAIEKMESEGTFNLLSKKEVIGLKKEYTKLDNLLSGIRRMRYMPKAIFVIDPIVEMNAVLEAKKLGIPVVSVVDTNCNPDIIDFPIPGNDDANKSVELFVTLMADAINEGKGKAPIVAYTKDEEIQFPPRRERTPRDGDRRPRRDGKRSFGNDRRDERKSFGNDRRDERKSFGNDRRDERKNFDKTIDNKPKKEFKAEIKVEAPKEVASNNNSVNLESMKLAELKAYAKEQGFKGYSSLKKGELVEFIKNGGNK